MIKKKSIIVAITFIAISALVLLGTYYTIKNVPELKSLAKRVIKNIDVKLGPLNKKKDLTKDIESMTYRLNKSKEIIQNYNQVINYASNVIGDLEPKKPCYDNVRLSNADFGLARKHDGEVVLFNLESMYTKDRLTLENIKFTDISEAGDVDIIKTASDIKVKVFGRNNEKDIEVNLVGEFKGASLGHCEWPIKLIFSMRKESNEVASASIKSNFFVENYYEELLSESRFLQARLSENSKVISRLSRVIRYAKGEIGEARNEKTCFSDNFHLKNTDFGYSDLFQGDYFSLAIGKEFTEKNLSLEMLKLKKLKHAGVVNLIKVGSKYELKLHNRDNKKPIAVELVGTFKTKGGEVCESDIRFNYFVKGIDITFLDKFESVSVLGKIGDDTGEFNLPYGSAFYQNALYITDCINANIQAFSKAGRRLYGFGEKGASSGQIYATPADVQIHNGKVFVAEGGNHRVEQFDLSGEYEKGWGSFGDATSNPTSKLGKFYTPFGVDFIDNMMIVS